MNILQIGLGPNPGGIENCIMNYYRHMDRNKFHFDFVDIYGQGLAYQNEMEALGSNVFLLPNYKQHPWKNFAMFKELFNNYNYDIVHINVLSAANIIPLLASKMFSKAKVVVHCHNSNIPGGTLRKFLNAINIYMFRIMADKKLACGIMAGQWMWGSSFTKDDIVYNAIDFDLYKPNPKIRKQMRQKCGFKDKDIVLGFVGRLCEQKNPLFLLDVLKELQKDKVSYKLLVVGDGEYRAKFEEKVRFLGLERNVVMVGVQQHVAEWYQAMDMFLLPSLFEGLPVVAIEAQAVGLKCLFSDSITRECDICSNVTFLSINKGADPWCNVIKYNIINNKIQENDNFDINKSIYRIEKVYVDIIL